MPPVIGITVGSSRSDVVLHRSYVEAVVAAGGVPLLIPSAASSPRVLDAALARVDHVILSGGGDIDSRRYATSCTTTLQDLDPERDEAEIRVVTWARCEGRRILGICRGAQLLAVASGGELVQDLPATGVRHHSALRHDRQYAELEHPIGPARTGTLASALLADITTVNSEHHQAIATTGEWLEASAWDDEGVIECVEGPDALGVQWHPELLLARDDRYLRPFTWLVQGEVTT